MIRKEVHDTFKSRAFRGDLLVKARKAMPWNFLRMPYENEASNHPQDGQPSVSSTAQKYLRGDTTP
jgi:hypothetical protein